MSAVTGPAENPGAHPVEEGIARLWADALGKQPPSFDADFFDVGGTSLALVRFLGGVQDTYGVELPMDQLFTGGFSVSYAAAAVEELLLAGVDPNELDTLVAELDSLSDDEIRVLLAEES